MYLFCLAFQLKGLYPGCIVYRNPVISCRPVKHSSTYQLTKEIASTLLGYVEMAQNDEILIHLFSQVFKVFVCVLRPWSSFYLPVLFALKTFACRRASPTVSVELKFLVELSSFSEASRNSIPFNLLASENEFNSTGNFNPTETVGGCT